MGNSIFAYPDLTLQSATMLSGNNWSELNPLFKLQDFSDTRMSSKARTVDCSLIEINVDLGSVQDIKLIAILGHNASKLGFIDSIKITLTDPIENPNDPIVWSNSTSILFYPDPFYPQGGLPWGHPDLWTGGTISDDDLKLIPKQLVIIPTTDYSIRARYIQITINDENNPYGYFELSRLFIAPGWQIGSNIQYGLQFGWETASTGETILGGPTIYDKRPSRRICNLMMELNEAQGIAFPYWMQRKLDIYGEMFFVYDPDSVSLLEKIQSFLCTMRELTPLEVPYFDANNVNKKLMEVL